MATIDECFRLLKYRTNKSGFDGNISPDDFNLLWPRAEMRWFNQQYKQFGITKKINDTLSAVKSAPTAITVDSSGRYTFPSNMLHEVSVTRLFLGTLVKVEEYTDDTLGDKLSSTFDAPNYEFPIYVRYANYLQFYPVDLSTGILTYLLKPTASKWGYILTNGRPVYNSATSVQPVWSDTDIDQIVYLVMQDMGINLRDGEVETFAQNEFKLQS